MSFKNKSSLKCLKFLTFETLGGTLRFALILPVAYYHRVVTNANMDDISDIDSFRMRILLLQS